MESQSRVINESAQSDCNLDTLKFGEVFLLTDVWQLNFRCHSCGIEMNNYRKFLQHSIEHSYIPENADIEHLYTTSLEETHEDDEIHNDEVSSEGFNMDAETQSESNDVQQSSQQKIYNISLKQSEETERAIVSSDQVSSEEISVTNKIVPEAEELSDSLSELDETAYKHVYNKESYLCDICHIHIKGVGHFKHHRERHLGIKKYICEKCAKAFFTNSELKTHIMRMHNDSRPFECKTCGVAFKVKQSLTHHMRRLHSVRPRPFVCSTCNRAFFTQRNLEVHLTCHNDIPAFTCTVCDKKFYTKKNLNRHKQLHSNDFKYRCSFCEKKFLMRKYLNYHLRTAHKDKLEEK